MGSLAKERKARHKMRDAGKTKRKQLKMRSRNKKLVEQRELIDKLWAECK